MRIVVCIKWVPNTMSVNIDPRTGTLIREGVPSVINPHDLNALEMALEFKDRHGGEVIVISMAPPHAKLGLEHAIGMGADKAILISDRLFAGADTLATSYTLSKAIERIGYDLIFTGQETIDSSTAHIGAQIASWLGIPYIYYVDEIDYVDGRLRVRRHLEDAVELYEVGIPALIATAMRANKPRYVNIYGKIRAKKVGVEVWNNSVLGLDEECIGLKGSPTTVSRIDLVPKVPRKGEVFKGDSKEAVKWLVDKLSQEGLI